MRQNLTLRYICTHGTPFLRRSLPRALHGDSHASGNADWIAVATLSEPPQTTKHEGNGATCSAFPNFKRPFRKKTLADPATSLCQQRVSGRAGIKPTTTAAFACAVQC